MNAGCFFTDGKLVFAGYQPGKSTPRISGFGGKPKSGEDANQTAIRETLEELLGHKNIPEKLVFEICHLFKPKKIIQQSIYFILVFSFQDLEQMLQLAKVFMNEKSEYYETIPLTIQDLIFKRNYTDKAEVQQLCILPLVKGIYIDKYFQEDINLSL